MPKISLTTFVDFTTAVGSTRLTKVRRAKVDYGQEYSPQKDFYKALREAIEESFEERWSAAVLKKTLAEVSDPKKRRNYEACRKGLTKWAVGGKQELHIPSEAASVLEEWRTYGQGQS